MSTSSLLLSLYQTKAWANAELYAEMQKLSPATHATERHNATRILNHIYVVDQIFAAHLRGEPHGYAASNTPETPELADLQRAVAASDQWYIDYVAALAPEQLQQRISFSFTDGDQGQMSREEILAHIITHGAYHRGAVGAIMRLAHVAPPRDLFTRYLHNAQPERRQGA